MVADATLVELARQGDAGAFSELFTRHRPSVAAVCSQRLRSAGDVDDAVQEAFARALGRLHQLKDPALFGPWVRSIAVRTCTDHHRAARRVIVLDDSDSHEVVDTAPRPDEMVELREHSVAVRDTLADLGERDRRALWLRHVADAPVAAVATELGLTEGSTRVLLTRARHRLRAAVTSLPVLVPLSWRQWLRDHLPVAGPAMQVLSVAVVLGVAAGGLVGGSEPQRRIEGDVPKAVVSDKARAERHGVAQARKTARTLPSADRMRQSAATASAQPRMHTAPQAEASTTSRRVVDRAVNSVKITNRYPDESETQEVIDVTVFANDDQNNVRLYADETNDKIEAARAAAEKTVGRPAKLDPPPVP